MKNLLNKTKLLWDTKDYRQKNRFFNVMVSVSLLLSFLPFSFDIPSQIQIAVLLLGLSGLVGIIMLAWTDMKNGDRELMAKAREMKASDPRWSEKQYKAAGIKIDHEAMIKTDNEIIKAMEGQFKV